MAQIKIRLDELNPILNRDVPVGIDATGIRRERDSVGIIAVPANRYWGAATHRSLRGGVEGTSLPERFHRSYGIVKKAAATANACAGHLAQWKMEAICAAADDLIAGRMKANFPLTLWQAGSGRHTDMNVNEVLTNRAIQLLGGVIGSRRPIDPVVDVDLRQDLAGSFTTAMHVAIVAELEEDLVPRVAALARALGRGAAARLRTALARIDEAEGGLHEIVRGDEAARPIAELQVIATSISAETGRPFVVRAAGTAEPGSLDAILGAMGAVCGLATAFLDIADIADIADTPDAAVKASFQAMVTTCVSVIGLDHVVGVAVMRGNREPRAVRPLIIASILDAIARLGQACENLLPIIRRGPASLSAAAARHSASRR